MENLLGKISVGIAGAITFIGGLLGITRHEVQPVVEQPTLGVALPQAVAIFETSLATPISSSATSLTLTANSIRGGGSLSGYNCFTIDEGSAQAEVVCGTVSGTSVTSVQRGLSYANATSTVAGNQFSHRRGANIKITDFPVIQLLKAQNNGEEAFENPIRYADSVSTTTLGTNGQNLASIAYANSLSFGGVAAASESASGFVELATGAEAASSTRTGSTGARLVLPTAISTSTAPTSGNVIPVTGSTGDIAEGFLPTTLAQNYTLSGTTTLSGLSTLSGTTTLTGFFDANYKMTEVVKLSATTTQKTAPVGTGSDETLYSTTIPANILSGNAVRMKLWISNFVDGNNNFSIKLNYDNTTLASINLDSINLNNAIDTGYIEAILMGVSTSTSSQKGVLRMDIRDEGQSVSGTELPTYFEQNFGTSTEDSTTDLVMSILVNQSAAENSVVLEMATVELIK